MQGSKLFFLLCVVGAASCGSKPNPFAPRPECMGATVSAQHGDRQMVVASVAIADSDQGFDLDGDGKIDNKLSALGAIANSQITTSFTTAHDIVLPIELFGYQGQADTTCTKLAFYVGRVNLDRDNDGSDTTWSSGKSDCMDNDATIHPGAAEVVGDFVDNNCDGQADEAAGGAHSTDTVDHDGDGYSMAQGDCDDRSDATNIALAKSRHPGAMDICNDGIDQDCDGIVDNDKSCDPFKMNDQTVYLTQLSFDPNNNPLITFKDGLVKANVFSAGPDLFSFTVPIKDIPLNLILSGAHMSMTLSDANSKTSTMDGLLGGVIEAATMAQITGLNVSSFIQPDQSLLDAVMLGGISNVLGLDQDADGHPLVDIDVDGDGIETFWQANPVAGQSAKIDTCKDGDGTIITSTATTPCALAKDAKGNYRFVDGISIALKYTAVPAQIGQMIYPK